MADVTAHVRRMSLPTRGLVAACVAAIALAAATSVAASDRATAPPTVDASFGAERLARTPSAEEISFELVLRMPRQQAFDAYVRDVDTPGTPAYRRFLTAEQIGARFGASDRALAHLVSALTERRLAVVDRAADRTVIRVSGRAGDVEGAFGVVLDDYRDARTGMRFHRPRGAPHLDGELRPLVRGLAGLDTQPPLVVGTHLDTTRRAAPRQSAATPPPTSLTPEVLARAFEIAPLRDRGVDGTGQYVAILAVSDLDDADVAAWDAATGTLAPPIEHVRVGSGRLVDDQLEAALDVDVVRAVAPKTQILLFSVSVTSPTFLADALREVVRDGRASIFSASFSACDAARSFEYMRWDRESSRQAVKSARAAGVNLVFSTGDWGAYPCRGKYRMDDLEATVAFPADTEFVTSVGGTSLVRGADGTYIEEAGWEDPLSLSGGGGGLSPTEDRPGWQRGRGVTNRLSNGRRQVPDVAAPGDPTNGYFVVVTYKGSRIYWLVGGTSGATPFWAGLLTLYQQMANDAGFGRLGFVNPMLYTIAAASEPDTVFHDVVRGGNLRFDATPGWDFSTGLGTPIAAPLGDAVLTYLRANGAGA